MDYFYVYPPVLCVCILDPLPIPGIHEFHIVTLCIIFGKAGLISSNKNDFKSQISAAILLKKMFFKVSRFPLAQPFFQTCNSVGKTPNAPD